MSSCARSSEVWYDNAARRIKLNLITGTPTAPARDVLQRDGVDDLTDIVMVTYTQQQLDDRLDSLTGQLGGIVASGHLKLSRDTASNDVLAELATATTDSERAQVQAAAGTAGVPVNVVNADDATFALGRDACANNPADGPDGLGLACDAPLRGGVRIESSASRCSAGFTARSQSDFKPYLLTAGHCLAGDSSSWALRGSSGSPNNDVAIGPPYRYVFSPPGDAALIKITNSDLSAPLQPIVIFNKDTRLTDGRNAHYTIMRSSYSRRGQYVCVTGATTGSHCGRITRENVPVVDNNNVRTDHLAEAHVCGIGEGDSGGPVIRGRSAVGLISASSGCVMDFQGAKTAEGLLNVTIAFPAIRPTP